MRLALQTGTPIVPIGIVGSEEQQPGLANWRGLARLLGMPAFPITPTFPWLGPVGLMPLPVRYHICFGEPLQLEGSGKDEDRVIEERVGHVRDAVMEQLDRGLALRKGIFA
jgi:1-acyl-sn-glycerol-3-phosphate acyltransferase